MGISNSAGGKGSSQRQAQVPKEVVDANWERIFSKKPSQRETEIKDNVNKVLDKVSIDIKKK